MPPRPAVLGERVGEERPVSLEETLLKNAPWKPVPYELADVSAIQALVAGTATPEQQRRALDWIIYKAAGTYDFPYRPGPDGARNTDLALGRLFVGQQIVKLTRLNLGKLRRSQPLGDPHEPKS